MPDDTQRGDSNANPHHRLSEVDEEARTGVCSVCGPVEVRVRPRRNQCMTVRRLENSRRPWKQRFMYGVSAPQMAALVAAAGGRCQICDLELGDGLFIDHCHETGEVRGLLCHRCNVALGWFNDRPERLLSAYMYLRASGKDEPAA